MADKKITDLTLRSNVNDDVNFPVDDGVQTYRVTGPQVKNYLYASQNSPNDALNYSLSASVAASALTLALKDAAGNNPGSANPVKIAFISTTTTDGRPVVETVTAPLSTVISSGSTAGHTNGNPGELHIYALNNGGTIELAWSAARIWNEAVLQDTTAEGGSGGADDGATLYSTTARTGKAIRYLGRMISTQTTAGTWAAVPLEIITGYKGSVSQYAQAYFDGGFNWVAPGSMGDFTAGGTGTFTVRKSKGISVVIEGTGLPGITFTPEPGAAYLVKAIVCIFHEEGTSSLGVGIVTTQLTDGSGNIISDPMAVYTNAGVAGFYTSHNKIVTLEGIFEPTDTSPQTIKLQAYTSGGRSIGGIATADGVLSSAITFIISRIP